ncbi:hypothetical protein TNCV_2253091 [Trichonephila clavipes]|nr:hypothetical protein TNCV_2253091 [Trichonephila clavipes]
MDNTIYPPPPQSFLNPRFHILQTVMGSQRKPAEIMQYDKPQSQQASIAMADIKVRKVLKGSTDRRGRSHSPQYPTSRQDRQIVRMAATDRSVT